MQQSNIYKLIKKFPYPFIVRHNRQKVYSQHPEMDFARLWRYSIRYSIVGYIVGKFIKMPWVIACVAPIPLIIKFLYDQYNLKKEGKYQELYIFQNWEIKKKINQIKKQEKEKGQAQQKNNQMQTAISFKQNYMGEGIVSTKEYVKRLPKEYYV